MFFLNFSKFMTMIILSILLCLSSSNLISMWMSFEINFYAFLPILINNNTFQFEKSLMMYFWVQSIASNTFIFMVLMTKMLLFTETMIYGIILIMFLKMGMFPFHTWVISIIEKMSWFMMMLLLTIQKFLPIMVLSMLISKKNFMVLIVINSITSSLSGMKTFSMRKILVFSSMNHLSIMIFSMMYSKKITFLYMMFYSYMNIILSKTFSDFNINMFNQMFSNSQTLLKSLSMIILVSSLMGLPPFLGFIPKTMTFMFLMEQQEFMFLLLFLISNTISTYFYLRLILSNMILSTNKEKNKKKMNKFNFTMIMLLPFLSNFSMM